MKEYKKYFIAAIYAKYADKAADIISQTNRNYDIVSMDTKFAKESKNPIDKRLDFCAYFLALIMTLDKKGEDFEAIRLICLGIVTEYVRPKNKWQAALKKLPARLIHTSLGKFLALYLHKRVRFNSNQDGFVAHIITDPKETYGLGYGIDIMECGICKLFSKHNYYKYASVLCEVDEITSSLAGLRLIRSGTIARGASKCDFRFIKEN